MFELKYQLTFEDYKKFMELLVKRRRQKNLKRNLVIGGIFIVLLLVATLANLSAPFGFFTLEGLSPLIILGIVYVLFSRFGVPRIWHKNFVAQKIGDSPAEMQADENELVSRQNGSEMRVNWSRLEEVTLTDEHLFLWLSPFQSLILPHRAFPSPKEAEAFSRFAIERIDASHD